MPAERKHKHREHKHKHKHKHRHQRQSLGDRDVEMLPGSISDRGRNVPDFSEAPLTRRGQERRVHISDERSVMSRSQRRKRDANKAYFERRETRLRSSAKAWKRNTTRFKNALIDSSGDALVQSQASDGLGKAASIESAEQFRMGSLNTRKETDDNDNTTYSFYSVCGDTIDDYGVPGGTELYMRFLMYLSAMFFAMFLVSIPSIAFYSSGDTFGFSSTTWLDAMTIGNIGTRRSNETMANSVLGLETKSVGVIVSVLDLICVCMFLWFLAAFTWIEEERDFDEDDHDTTVKDYSVEVFHLPKERFTRKEIKEHFEMFGRVMDVAIIYNRVELLRLYSHRHMVLDERAGARIRGDDTKKYDGKLRNIVSQIKALEHDNETKAAQSAYITFETPEMRDMCVHENYFVWEPDVTFKGSGLHVKRAPAPSDINADSFDITKTSKYLRRAWSFLCLFLLLIASLAIVVAIMDYKSSLPREEPCEQVYSTSYVTSGNATNDEVDCYCADLNYDELLQQQDTCDRSIKARAEINLVYFALSCVATAIVVSVSIIVPALTYFENHHLKSRSEAYIMLRIFVVSFIITGVMVALVAMDLEKILGISWWFPAAKNKYESFTATWFETIGFSLTVTLIMQAGVACIPLGFMCLASCKRAYGRMVHERMSQGELNDYYDGADLYLGEKHANILVCLYITLVYSPGIPFLYLIMSGMCLLTYFVEKLALAHHYRNPPVFDNTVTLKAIRYAQFAAVPHFFMSILTFGEVLPSYKLSTGQSGKVFNEANTLPHAIMLIMACSYIAYRIIVGFFPKVSNQCLEAIGLECLQTPDDLVGVRPFIEELALRHEDMENYHVSNRFEYQKAFQSDGLKKSIPFYKMPEYKDFYYREKKV